MKRPDIRDHDGNRLVPTLMQVLETEDGTEKGPPRLVALRSDDEEIDLAEMVRETGRDPRFLIVWSPPAIANGRETGLPASTLLAEQGELRDRLGSSQVEARTLRRALDAMRDEAERLGDEVAAKTAALRELQRERDPSRVEARVAEAVAAATHKLEIALVSSQRQLADMTRERDELRASKRKLREALERAKERR